MFIPIFPFSKSWTLKVGSDSYKMSPEGIKFLDAMYGKKSMPWYAFAGPILVFAFMLFGFVADSTKSTRQAFASKIEASNKASKFEDNVEATLAKISAPATNDYYELTENGVNTFYKVSTFTQDSITFMVPSKNEANRWYKRSTKILFFEKPEVAFESRTIAKKDLEKALNKVQNAINFRGVALTDLSIVLQTVDRVDRSFIDNELVRIKKEQEIKVAFNQFLVGTNLDSAVLSLDEASANYFEKVLTLAKEDDIAKIKTFVKQSKHPSVTYKYMLYTKYVYLKSMNKAKEEVSKADEFKEHVFFLKLVEQGLWSLRLEAEAKKTLNNGRISFRGDNHASISVMTYSNMLTKSVPIHFTVNFNKQEGQWKINVPSTFAYTEKQIERAAMSESSKKKYRFSLIEEVEKMDVAIRISPDWFF